MDKMIDVPTVDVSPLFGDNTDAKMCVANQIHLACRGSGFFYISNHGIEVDKLQEVINDFHQTMTNDEKWNLAINAYNKDNSRNRNGYYMAIPGKKAVESYCYLNPTFTHNHPMIKAKIPTHEVNIWPDPSKHPKFQPFCEEHYWNMFHLSSYLLKGFALALGKAEDFFDPYFRADETLSSASMIRYPYLKDYPPVKTAPDGAKLSFEDHLDVSLITILFQTPIPNLQVEMTGKFKDIPTSAYNLLVNCGTYMPYITNNYFHAPNHRVVFINGERLSLPFFVNLGYNTTIQPFTPHNPEGRSDTPVVSCGQYLQDGLQALIVKNGQT